jgi:predicted phosphoribosyltransferase
MRFVDRVDAGQRLGARLAGDGVHDVVVLGLPRGGVPVAAEVARVLHAPLDVIIVRKLGVPWQPEFAMGAIGEDGVRVLNSGVIRRAAISDDQVAAVERAEREHLQRRIRQLRSGRPRVPVVGRTVVIVDDGIATGASAGAACQVARAHAAATIMMTAPIGTATAMHDLLAVADTVICLRTFGRAQAVSEAYDDFTPVSDDEVADLLTAAAAENRQVGGPVTPST